MDVDQPQALTAPLTAAERDQVKRAAAAGDPFAVALERAADTIAGRAAASQHD